MASYTAPMRSSTPQRTTPGMDAAANVRAQQQHRPNSVQQQLRATPVQTACPVAILWDIENCPVPGEVNAEDVAGNIRIALRDQAYVGAVTMFSAYGDFNHFPRKVREGCQRTGVNLIDVPNGKKDAADKAILVDMFLFALDNPPPSTIFLITGDVDFAPALHKLGQRGYVVVLVIPDGVGVSSALRGAGRYVWDWPSLCRGEGFVQPQRGGQGRTPNSMYLAEDRNQGRFPNTMYVAAEDRVPLSQFEDSYRDYNGGTWVAEEPDTRNDEDVYGEEILAWRVPNGNFPPSSPYSQVHTATVDYGHQQYATPGQLQPQGQRMGSSINRNPVSAPTFARTPVSGGFQSRPVFSTHEPGHAVASAVQPGMQTGELSPPADMLEPTSPGGSLGTSWVQPGDLSGLKRQLTQLLKLNGGKMMLSKVPAEYNKQFGRPLYLAEYNAQRLVHLIEKMKDTLVIKGDGTSKTLHLAKRESRNNKYKPTSNRSSTAKGDKDKDGSEDSEPEGTVVAVKEVEKETSKVDAAATDLLNKRHLLDMDMDEVIVAQASVPSDWNTVAVDCKSNIDASRTETVVDVSEADTRVDDHKEDALSIFKQQLQELLVVYTYNIKLKLFSKIYQQRYAKDLDLKLLGADSLESLFQKVKDVAVIKETAPKEFMVVAV